MIDAFVYPAALFTLAVGAFKFEGLARIVIIIVGIGLCMGPFIMQRLFRNLYKTGSELDEEYKKNRKFPRKQKED